MQNYTYTELTTRLTERLGQPLPGEAAQRRMASSIRSALRLPDRPNERTRAGAVCMLLYPEPDGWYLPLILRPEYDGAHSGQVALPGGRVEETDTDVVAAALRETEEEIGVPTARMAVMGKLTPLYVPASNFVVHPVVAVASEPPVFRPDPREVAAVFHVPVAQLLDETLRGETEIRVRGIRIQAPYFNLLGQTVWGATAMMLSELKEVMRGSDEP
ncbi:MAG: CoA pyrophosphatase [Cytophagales bacterium]|nr:CoA pyrophosphatase [Cytophagales bacterium]